MDTGPPRSSQYVVPLEYSLYDLFVERLLTWQVTLNASLEFFRELADIERSRERGYRRAAAILAPRSITSMQNSSSLGNSMINLLSRSGSPSPVKQPESGGSSPLKPPDRGNIWLVPLQAAALKADSEAAGLASYIENEVIVRLQEIKALYKEHRNSIRLELEKTYKELNLHHDRLTNSVTIFQQISENQVDGWLSEVQLRGRIDGWIRNLDGHYRVLMQILTNIRSLDAQLTLRIGSVINEYFILASKTAAIQSEQLQDMSRLIQAVDTNGEWMAALTRGRLDYDWQLRVPPVDAFQHSVLSTCSPTGQTHSIRKAGFLMKQAGGFGRSWSIYFCILTDSHYLHGYRTAGLDEGGKLEWMRIPSSSIQLHKKALAELNEIMLNGMFNERPELLAEPAISVYLGGPGIVCKSENHSFSLNTIQSGGFFGRSEKRYIFKSWTEEDLEEWIGTVRDGISVSQQAKEVHVRQPPPQTQQQVQHQHYQQQQQEQSESHEIQDKYYQTNSCNNDERPNSPSSLNKEIFPEMENPWKD